jgi:hypothetical protein
MRFSVVLVVRPGESEQHIGIEQSNSHEASSAIISLARLLGMIAAPGPTSNTGKPRLVAFRVGPFKPRRASIEITFPSFCPEASACARAASSTSSSIVTVVLIKLIH